MTNQHTRPIETTLFVNKLNSLLTDLHKKWQSGSLATEHDVIEEFNARLNEFFNNLRHPNFNPIQALPGTLPRHEDLNYTFSTISQDIEVIFKELQTAENVVLSNFNHIVTERDRLNKEIKAIGSKLGDYILFTSDPLGKVLYYKDSFNDLSRIDVGNSRLNATQAEVNRAEGIVTLAINRGAGQTSQKVEEAIINSNSNGQIGNNFQLNASIHNDIDKILDNNPDSWFEYERVQRTATENTDPLKLDLTLRLSEEQVINFIRVNPNNFGTQNWLTISEIETSVDGNTFISIKDDIPVSGFLAEDEENIFRLAPSVSKFAGEGLYTFIPRKAKYIHIILLQDTSYPIDTPTGVQQRFAIGVRDIEIHALPYEVDSELISIPFVAPEEIKKISLLASENPTDASELADVKHQISPDDGNTWYDIQPQGRTGVEVPEILNFNTADDDSIATPTPITEVRHKLIINRDTAAFTEGASTLRQTVEDTVELVNLPSTSPFRINIENAPVDGTVAMLNPLFGSRGKEDPKLFLGLSNGDEVKFTIPLEPRGDIRDKINFKNELRAFVDGIEWYRVGAFTDDDPQTASAIDESSKVFLINNQNQIIFGDGILGKIPIAGSIIGLTIEPENIYPTSDSPHTADLQFDSDGNKRHATIRRVDPLKTITNEQLTKNAQVFRIKNEFLDLSSIRIKEKDNSVPPVLIADTGEALPAGAGTFRNGQRKDFVDGASELLADGDWSMDTDNGILYSFAISSAVNTISITYSYTPKLTLTDAQWDFVIDPSDNIRRSIEIKPIAYTTNSAEQSVPAGVKVINLDDTGIVPKTLTLPADTFTSLTAVEIPFIDGIIELSNVVQVDNESIDSLDSSGDPLHTFTLQNGTSLESSFSPVFNNTTLYAVEKASIGVLAADGEYFVSDVGLVTVYWDTGGLGGPLPTDLGEVSYYFKDSGLDGSLPGKYSVDYKRGVIYCFTVTATPTDNITYQFTNYEIDYNIAKSIDPDSFSVDAQSQEISINDTEIIKAYNSIDVLSRTRQVIKVMYEYVQRTRDSIEELEPYFSPIVKDYVLKVLTKSRL